MGREYQVADVNFLTRAIAVVLVLTQGLVAARAQSFAPPEPATRVREALASPYGRALIAELGKNLPAGADPACLNSKAIATDQLEARGLALMTKWGVRMAETSESIIDQKIYAEKFSGQTELAKLRNDATVKRYLAIAQPIQQANLLDSMFEQFDRYVLISRIKLAQVSALPTGNEALLNMNPGEAAEEKLDKFTSASKSAALKRYLALTEQDAAARKAAIRKDQLTQPVPSILFGGVEADLAELCIAGR